MEYKIALIHGDGIGPEIVEEAKKVLDKVCDVFGHSFTYKNILLGGASIDVHGVPLTEEAVSDAKSSDGIHRRRCKDLSLVSAGTIQTTGGRIVGNPKGAEFICQFKTGIFV